MKLTIYRNNLIVDTITDCIFNKFVVSRLARSILIQKSNNLVTVIIPSSNSQYNVLFKYEKY